MRLTDEQKGYLNGDAGPTLQWAMEFNHRLGRFFGASEMVPVASAHFAPDIRMGGAFAKRHLEAIAREGARIQVPGFLDPCSVDFTRAAEMVASYGLTEGFVAEDRELQQLCRRIGFLPTYTCINYQTITPPRFGEHLAWGDTGAAICANAIFGARTNFEGGPSALASALVGCTPAFGMHCRANRLANVLVKIDCDPLEIADWGAVAVWSGKRVIGYDTVPAFVGSFRPPTFNMVKQLAVALASYGGHAMFHLVGVTPEADSIEAACGGAASIPTNTPTYTMTPADLEAVFASTGLPDTSVDLVVFAAPQLAIGEVQEIVERLDGRRLHENTKLIIAADPQVKLQADNAGLTDRLQTLGAEFTTGTCFYPEAPLMREATGWKNVVTNSAKLVNALSSSGYHCALRRLAACLDAATSGRLPS